MTRSCDKFNVNSSTAEDDQPKKKKYRKDKRELFVYSQRSINEVELSLPITLLSSDLFCGNILSNGIYM